MKPLLRNPVYYSLRLNDSHLGFGSGHVVAFDEAVSPFAGFEEGNTAGFDELHHLLPAGRSILYATPQTIDTPPNWKLSAAVEGLQFLYEGAPLPAPPHCKPTALTTEHVPQMMELAKLTKPGPFGPRTIEFGHYYGVFEGGKLVAMTGQRLHVESYTEISAVCTHPDYLGKGYATALVQQQVNLIISNNQVPFLHVRADNHRAIAVYERLGFAVQGPMNFYFLKKE
ncbi:MAG: GNAT family N-acetyltransferase [Chitinophagaceae bacterium]